MPHESPPSARVERHREARRVILDAASALLDQEGEEGLTIRRLALRSGYAPPAIYRHFGDKTGLLDAVLEEAFRGLVERLEALKPEADPAARMREQFVEIVRFGLENPIHYRLMSAARPEDAPPVPAAEEARLCLEEPLEVLAERRQLAVDDLEAVRQSLWALLHGLIALPTSRPEVEWRENLAAVALDAMLAGLVADPVSSPSEVG